MARCSAEMAPKRMIDWNSSGLPNMDRLIRTNRLTEHFRSSEKTLLAKAPGPCAGLAARMAPDSVRPARARLSDTGPATCRQHGVLPVIAPYFCGENAVFHRDFTVRTRCFCGVFTVKPRCSCGENAVFSRWFCGGFDGHGASFQGMVRA